MLMRKSLCFTLLLLLSTAPVVVLTWTVPLQQVRSVRRRTAGGVVCLVGPLLHAKKNTSRKKPSGSKRQNRVVGVANLQKWATECGIQTASVLRLESSDAEQGLGWWATADVPSGSVVISVPSSVALTVESPGVGTDDSSVRKLFPVLTDLPWYVQFACYLCKLDKVNDSKGKVSSYRPWLDSLPRGFTTPIHWSAARRQELLQYNWMVDAVQRQEEQWKSYHQRLSTSSSSSDHVVSWDDFLWGCEVARSRAFSSTVTPAFNPSIYLFTLLLVTVYVGLNLGTLEQAANGAALVLSASILKDFVVPKLFKKKKKYVICPMIDFANHRSSSPAAGEVNFEYFGNSYSLAVVSTTGGSGSSVKAGDQVYISYGTRSNDQLLQYYGFVESDNPHDVYVMPPLRQWNIEELERACGRTFAPGRLEKLDRAGLLGGGPVSKKRDDDEAANNDSAAGAGVVLTRSAGLDPAALQALRTLVSTDQEWDNRGQAVGNFAVKVGTDNEQCARLVAAKAIEMELASKPTTLEEDQELLKRMDAMESLDTVDDAEVKLALQFRIEKKKLLKEVMNGLLK